MNNPTPEQLSNLPQWAKKHLERVERERDALKDQVSRLIDSQTDSPIWVDEWAAKPPFKRYVPCTYRNLVIEHAFVRAEIHLARTDDSQRLHGIEITYHGRDIDTSGHEWDTPSDRVSLVPRAPGTIQLVNTMFL